MNRKTNDLNEGANNQGADNQEETHEAGTRRKAPARRVFNTVLALLAISAEASEDICGIPNLSGKRGIYNFAYKMNMGEYQLKSAIQSLERNGFIEKTADGLLITPKGKKRVKFLRYTKRDTGKKKWDGLWRVVIFDIPESLRSSRDLFRSCLKRNGFVRLQDSVFVSPFADFDELNDLRYECKVEKYVNFLEAKSVNQDDDSILKEKFDL